jgi:hypothetical protein
MSTVVRPITPEEAQRELPNDIVERVNNLIKQNWNGSSAKVTIKAIKAGCSYREGDWRGICKLFREYGWDVENDFPGYCESYDAFLLFRRAKK